MLRKEEGLSEDLTGLSSRRRSDGCDRVAWSDDDDDLSSSESEFLRKRNSNKGEQWM
jgi:hypothetical protein